VLEHGEIGFRGVIRTGEALGDARAQHLQRVARERGGAVCVVDVRVIPGYDSNLGGNARGAAAAARR